MEINMEKKSERVLGYSVATMLDKDRLAEVYGGVAAASGASGGKVSCGPTFSQTGPWTVDIRNDC